MFTRLHQYLVELESVHKEQREVDAAAMDMYTEKQIMERAGEDVCKVVAGNLQVKLA